VGKIAVLRMGNITNVGTIDYSNLVYSSNDEDIEQYSLEKNDLLFNRTNSSEWVGKTAIYKEEQPAIYAGYLIRIKPLLISPDYLNTVMNSGYYRDWCYDVKTDAVNQSLCALRVLWEVRHSGLAAQVCHVSQGQEFCSWLVLLQSANHLYHS